MRQLGRSETTNRQPEQVRCQRACLARGHDSVEGERDEAHGVGVRLTGELSLRVGCTAKVNLREAVFRYQQAGRFGAFRKKLLALLDPKRHTS